MNDKAKDLKAQALQYLKEQILYCDMPPGSIITEEAISEQLGISRTPIREALLELQYAGYIEIVPRKYIRVTRISLKDLKAIYEARLLIESSILGRLDMPKVEEHKPQLLQLKELWEDFKKVEPTRENRRYLLQNDIALHTELVAIDNNPYLTQFIADLINRFQRFWYFTSTNVERRMPKIIDEHLYIINNLLSGNFASAEECMHIHILDSYETLGIISE